MIKLYTTAVIGVDADDEDRTLFTLSGFDETCANLKIDTLVSLSTIGLLFDAIQQGLERLELERE